MGEINSEFSGTITWQDTSHCTVRIKKATGVISNTVHPGDIFKFEIIKLDETRLRFRVSNLEVQPIIELTKVSNNIN